jgi:hypothetical protein
MDEPSAIMGASHRRVRHDPFTTPQEAKKLFGENADHACLDHIRLDELESRRKGITKIPKSAVPNPFVGVISLILAVILFFAGIYFFSSASLFRSGAWAFVMMGITFLVGSVIFGLVFIGSFIRPKQTESPTFSYPITKPPNWGETENKVTWENITNRCPKCGANYSSQNEKCPFCGEPS